MSVQNLTCLCQGHCPQHVGPSGTCTVEKGGYCYATFADVPGSSKPEWSLGCLTPHTGYMQCRTMISPKSAQKSLMCCSESDLCNGEIRQKYESLLPSEPSFFTTTNIIIGTLIGITLLFIIIGFIFLKFYRKRSKLLSGSSHCPMLSINKSIYSGDHSAETYVLDGTTISGGSGAGAPLLIKRSFAKDITLIKSIGKGRYGEVWLGNWQGEKVAVKRFHSHEQALCERESEIYSTTMMCHENILTCLGSDIISLNSTTEFWLVTHYHEHGSLYDFLFKEKLSVEQCCSILRSIISGLLHLHTEITGNFGKPAIAHRDINSKNILIKSPTVACIADFSLAVSYQTSTNKMKGPHINVKDLAIVGTTRYFAPEILDGSLNSNSIEAYKAADIYSFALVMWETCRRALINNNIYRVSSASDNSVAKANCSDSIASSDSDLNDNVDVYDYKVPYFDVVNAEPTLEEMRKFVVVDGYRPPIPSRWDNNLIMAQVADIIQECWNLKPAARLTALRIKKRFNTIMEVFDQAN